jgi:hypothetical protein
MPQSVFSASRKLFNGHAILVEIELIRFEELVFKLMCFMLLSRAESIYKGID